MLAVSHSLSTFDESLSKSHHEFAAAVPVLSGVMKEFSRIDEGQYSHLEDFNEAEDVMVST